TIARTARAALGKILSPPRSPWGGTSPGGGWGRFRPAPSQNLCQFSPIWLHSSPPLTPRPREVTVWGKGGVGMELGMDLFRTVGRAPKVLNPVVTRELVEGDLAALGEEKGSKPS